MLLNKLRFDLTLCATLNTIDEWEKRSEYKL